MALLDFESPNPPYVPGKPTPGLGVVRIFAADAESGELVVDGWARWPSPAVVWRKMAALSIVGVQLLLYLLLEIVQMTRVLLH